jgi:hypothetical protein
LPVDVSRGDEGVVVVVVVECLGQNERSVVVAAVVYDVDVAVGV